MENPAPDIAIHDTPVAFILRVRGVLGESAARELEACWRTGSSALGGRDLLVDLTGTRSLGPEAIALLPVLSKAGARFITRDGGVEMLVREATGLAPVPAPATASERSAGWLSRLFAWRCRFVHCPDAK